MKKFVCQWFDLEKNIIFDLTYHNSFEECKQIAAEGVSGYMAYKNLDDMDKNNEKIFVITILEYEHDHLIAQCSHCSVDGWKWFSAKHHWQYTFANLIVFPPKL